MNKKWGLPCKHVSHTAWLVASFRAQESDRKDAIFHDVLAKKLLGHLEREYLQGFSEQVRHDPWFLSIRTYYIDSLIQKSIKEGVDTILNLGAGLDTRPYRLDISQKIRWFESDYADMINYKNEMLKDDSPRCQLTRIPADLSQTSERQRVLSQVNDKLGRTLVLTEGLLGYLMEQNVSELAQELYSMPSCHFWLADIFNQSMLDSLETIWHDTLQAEKEGNVQFTFIPKDTATFLKPFGWDLREFISFEKGMNALKRFPQGMDSSAIRKARAFDESGIALFQAKDK